MHSFLRPWGLIGRHFTVFWIPMQEIRSIWRHTLADQHRLGVIHRKERGPVNPLHDPQKPNRIQKPVITVDGWVSCFQIVKSRRPTGASLSSHDPRFDWRIRETTAAVFCSCLRFRERIKITPSREELMAHSWVVAWTIETLTGETRTNRRESHRNISLLLTYQMTSRFES